MEVDHGIIHMKRSPVIPGESPAPPGTPRGRPWDLRDHKNGHISSNVQGKTPGCCIRILSLQRITPRTSLDCFIMYISRTEPFLVGHRAARGGPQAPRKESTHIGRRSLPIRRQVRLQFIYQIYIYAYIHVCGERDRENFHPGSYGRPTVI